MDSQPQITIPQSAPVVPSLEPKSKVWLWIVGGILLLGVGIAGGVFLGKQLYSQNTAQINSYDQCVAVKGSQIEESYPAVCITTGGRRFIQPTSINSVFCGGWNTGGSLVCKCTGKLIRPVCPPKTVCDAIDYRCEGQCGQCCWKGVAGNNQYPKCQD